jgi:hypothetical protein
MVRLIWSRPITSLPAVTMPFIAAPPLVLVVKGDLLLQQARA